MDVWVNQAQISGEQKRENDEEKRTMRTDPEMSEREIMDAEKLLPVP